MTGPGRGAEPAPEGRLPAEPGACPDDDWRGLVVDSSPDGVLLVDDGVIAFVNPTMERMSGWAREDLVGRPVETLVPEDLRPRHEALRREYGVTPRERPMGDGLWLRLRRADGERLRVEIALAPVDVSGRVMTLATVRDVSARWEAQEELSRLAWLLDLVPDSVIVVDLATSRVQHANRAATDLLGYTEDELVGMPTATLWPEEAATTSTGTGPFPRDVLTDRQDLREVLLRTRAGKVVECEVHGTVVDGPTGGRVLVNVVRDVGERLALERRLRESEESLRAAFEQAPVGIAITRVDDDGRRTFVRTNPALEEMFGYPAGALEGLDTTVLVPAESRLRAAAGTATSKEARGRTITRRYVRRDGCALWAEVRAIELDLPAEEGSLFLVHAVDVTSRVHGETRARKQAQITACIADVAQAALARRPETVVLEHVAAGARDVLEGDAGAVLLTGADGATGHRWGATAGDLTDALAASDDAELAGVLLGLAPDEAVALPALPPGVPARFARLVGPIVLAPFGQAGSPPNGAVLACRTPTGPAFTEEDAERLARLATQSQVAVHLARARADQQRLALLEERQRIARELHDTVIQDVIAVGMQISADVDAETDAGRQERDLDKVSRLESATRNLRRAVFELRGTSRRSQTATEVTDIVAEASRMLGHFPSVTFSGPVDALPEAVADDLVAVLREALANTARHADATRSAVSLAVTEESVTLTVDDDGVGLPGTPQVGYGLDYIGERARRHGGQVVLGPGPVVGTRLVWTCPLTDRRDDE